MAEYIDRDLDIGSNIKQILKEKNCTQKELAVRVGTSKSAISEIIHHKRIPTAVTLSKIATSLGVSVYEIAPELDVVPRSLLDTYKQKVEDTLERLNTINEDKIKVEVFLAKQEVAKQIFEEIDTTIRTDIKANNRYYGDYQEGRNNAFYTVIRQLAELKKKYIGKDTDVPTNKGE